jgi:hypothetical protein
MSNFFKKFALLALSTTLAAFVFTAQAHEYRYIGNNYAIQVGSEAEPPVAGPNKAVVFAYYRTVPGDINSEVTLDRTAGDKVELVALPLKVASENYNAPIVQFIFPILSHFGQTVIEEQPAYLSEEFNYTAAPAGKLAYLVTGEIKKKGKTNKFFVEKFVCGGGTKDVEFGTFFDCVE